MAWPNLPISLYWFVLKVEFPLSDIGKQNFEHLQILNPFLRAFGSTIKISFRLKLQVSKRFIWKFIYREEMQSLEGRSSRYRSLEYPELLMGNGRGKWFVISYETPLLFIRIIFWIFVFLNLLFNLKWSAKREFWILCVCGCIKEVKCADKILRSPQIKISLYRNANIIWKLELKKLWQFQINWLFKIVFAPAHKLLVYNEMQIETRKWWIGRRTRKGLFSNYATLFGFLLDPLSYAAPLPPYQ